MKMAAQGGRSMHDSHRERPLILLAEDDDDVRDVFEMVLADHYDVVCAETGEQALSRAHEHRPDVVLLDWTLPDLAGDEVVRRLREAAPPVSSAAIVLVTGSSSVEALAQRLNVVACPKPCDVEHLLSAIRQALAARASHHQQEETPP
jgi:DNA-binding response OmpR family regulator